MVLSMTLLLELNLWSLTVEGAPKGGLLWAAKLSLRTFLAARRRARNLPARLYAFPRASKMFADNAESPGGSSSGSAQGIAAGFTPLSIGTETTGSLTTPAGRAALYALKLTPGSTSPEGVFRVTDLFDSIGVMSKSAEDIAILSEILQESTSTQSPKRRPIIEQLEKNWQDFSIGFVDISEWWLSEKEADKNEQYLRQSVICTDCQFCIVSRLSISLRSESTRKRLEKSEIWGVEWCTRSNFLRTTNSSIKAKTWERPSLVRTLPQHFHIFCD